MQIYELANSHSYLYLDEIFIDFDHFWIVYAVHFSCFPFHLILTKVHVLGIKGNVFLVKCHKNHNNHKAANGDEIVAKSMDLRTTTLNLFEV